MRKDEEINFDLSKRRGGRGGDAGMRGDACLRRVAFGKSSAKLFNFLGALVVEQDFSLRLRLVKKIPHCRLPLKGC